MFVRVCVFIRYKEDPAASPEAVQSVTNARRVGHDRGRTVIKIRGDYYRRKTRLRVFDVDGDEKSIYLIAHNGFARARARAVFGKARTKKKQKK